MLTLTASFLRSLYLDALEMRGFGTYDCDTVAGYEVSPDGETIPLIAESWEQAFAELDPFHAPGWQSVGTDHD